MKLPMMKKTAAEVVARAKADLAAIHDAEAKRSETLYEQSNDIAQRAYEHGKEATRARRAAEALDKVEV